MEYLFDIQAFKASLRKLCSLLVLKIKSLRAMKIVIHQWETSSEVWFRFRSIFMLIKVLILIHTSLYVSELFRYR